jgi:hypothetical protein
MHRQAAFVCNIESFSTYFNISAAGGTCSCLSGRQRPVVHTRLVFEKLQLDCLLAGASIDLSLQYASVQRLLLLVRL